MIRALAYTFVTGATLSILAVMWAAVSDASLALPFVVAWGVVLFPGILSHVMTSDLLTKGLRSMDYFTLFTRAFFCGVITFSIWLCLYYLGLKFVRYELALILIGVGLGYAVAILGIGLFALGAEPGAAPNGGPAAAVDNPNAPEGPPSVS